ncbi:MAG: hypothetical protein ACRD1T_09480, partial [Acidimicrobiia bacterium]
MRGDERPELRAVEEVRQTLAVAAVSRDGHAVSLRVRVDLGVRGCPRCWQTAQVVVVVCRPPGRSTGSPECARAGEPVVCTPSLKVT